jgi:hypothetical protein
MLVRVKAYLFYSRNRFPNQLFKKIYVVKNKKYPKGGGLGPGTGSKEWQGEKQYIN